MKVKDAVAILLTCNQDSDMDDCFVYNFELFASITSIKRNEYGQPHIEIEAISDNSE